MAVSSGGWMKFCVAIGIFWLLAGCSYGELEPFADTDLPDDNDARVILDVLDATSYDGDSAWFDTSEPDIDEPDVEQNDASDSLDSGMDSGMDAALDADPADVSKPEPDVSVAPDVRPPEPDVGPPAPCARVKITLAAGTTIRSKAQNAASSVGLLRKNSVVVTVTSVYGDSVSGNKVWHQIKSPSGNGFIPSAHVACTNDAPHIEPPPLSEVCPRAKITPSQGVNIRTSSNGTGYVGGLCQGSIVEVVAKVKGKVVEGDDTWYQIKSPKGNGYIAGKYAECTHSALRITNC